MALTLISYWTVQNTHTKENNRIRCTTIQELIHFHYNKGQYLTNKYQPSVIISTKNTMKTKVKYTLRQFLSPTRHELLMHILLGWKDSLINFPARYLKILSIIADKKLSQEYFKHHKKHSYISQWYKTVMIISIVSHEHQTLKKIYWPHTGTYLSTCLWLTTLLRLLLLHLCLHLSQHLLHPA